MNRQEELYFRYHVVCILDFLGEKSRLAEWANLDVNKPPDEPQPCIVRTVGRILGFQEFITKFLAQFEEPRRTERAAQSLSPEKLDAFKRSIDCPARTQQFSDTFVLYAPIVNSRGDVSTEPICRMLGACCTTMVWSLAAEAPIRGSICVGLGVEIDDHNFYGPALAEAHHIESELAQWPRVIVSKSAEDFISSRRNQKGNGDLTKITRSLVGLCESMICQACDGQPMVDFLGKGVQSIQDVQDDKSSLTTEAVRKGYEFVRSEADKFRQAGDTKLALRYHLLQQYIESRLPLWGLKQS